MEALESYFKRLERKNFRRDLGPIKEACHLLNNPQFDFPTLHIVGTNGKGSVAAFLSSLLQSAGYRIGLYTSPHLLTMRERIQINRLSISEEALFEIVRCIREILPSEEYLSYFEMITLAAFEYFSKMEVDAAIVEAGLGGRFDATNILSSQMVLFTPISFDHQQHLGKTLTNIACEKCGVLKEGVIIVSAPQPEEAKRVIEKTAVEKKCPLYWADPSAVTSPLGLKGEHQRTNAAVATLAADLLLEETLPKERAKRALLETEWPGRLDYVSLRPPVLLDAAHNPAGMEAVALYLKENHSDRRIHFLVGVLCDKNWQTMFQPLAERAWRFITVSPDSERGLPAAELAKALIPFGKPVEIFEGPLALKIEELLQTLGNEELLVATGSLYVIGEALRCFQQPVYDD